LYHEEYYSYTHGNYFLRELRGTKLLCTSCS